MREPVIEDNASDHALFCKYAAELLERVTGKALDTSTAVPSLSRITKVLQLHRTTRRLRCRRIRNIGREGEWSARGRETAPRG